MSKLRRSTLFGLAAAVAVSTAAPAHAEDNTNTSKRNTRTHASNLAGDAKAAVTFRLAGTDRIQTAIKASQDAWPVAGQEGAAKAVVLSRSDDFADALGGSALSGAAFGPLLLTSTASLHADVQTEIARILGATGKVYVLGGEDVVSAAVATKLTSLGYTVVRLAGTDRVLTSIEISKEISKLAPEGKQGIVFGAEANNFPDGLAAGATAGGYWGSVVLLGSVASDATARAYLAEMKTAGTPIVAVGGHAGMEPVAWSGALVGNDRYETAALVADAFWGDPAEPLDNATGVGIATGLNWPDALSGGAYMTGLGPLLLARTDSLPTPTVDGVKAVVASNSPSSVQFGAVFGGTSVVSDTVGAQLDSLLP